jgi:biotin operon repressor
MNKGWIKIHRKFMTWEWYDDINTKVLFIHLLLTVNFEDKKWRGQAVKRGERITSLAHLAEETGLSVQQVRTSIKKLKSTCEVTSRATSRFTLISICKYNEYQDVPTSQATSQPTNEQQTDNKRVTTTKEPEERKERKKPTGGNLVLIKWLKTFKGVIAKPEAYAATLEKKYTRRVIDKALKNPSCVSLARFSVLLEQYS